MGKVNHKRVPLERVPLKSYARRKLARSMPQPKTEWVDRDFELLSELAAIESRESFWAFRQYMNPGMKLSWFQADMAVRLQDDFYRAWLDGKAPTMVIMAPPQHGKSETAIDFFAWLLGKHPDLKEIFASYSDELGISANSRMQRLLDSERYQQVFPKTRLNQTNSVGGRGGAQRNSSMLQVVGERGSFYNTTVEGQITGKGLDMGLIDDPLKGRKAANSPTIRNSVWNWFIDDFFTRFSENAAFLMILTRWHIDDPAGRFIQLFPDTIVVTYEAIATKNGKFRKKGEALFPEHKSLAFLLKRKKAMVQNSWESLYQQNPLAASGTMFTITRFKIAALPPTMDEIKRTIRYWDKAGTKEGMGAETAGVLMHELQDGRTFIEDCIHGRWDAFEREEKIKHTADVDIGKYPEMEIWTEQEPGSGGKESAQRTVLMLRGMKAFADRVTGDKVLRAEPYSAQVQAGLVTLKRAPWNREFLDQHEFFPNLPLKDMVDSSGGAFAKLTNRDSDYDESMGWVG